MNKISQTIEEDKVKAMIFCRDYIYSLRDAGYDIPEAKRVELEHFIKSHLLQSQIRLLEVVIEEMKERNKFTLQDLTEAQNDAYGQALEDQISSLNETLEFLKKSL